MSLITIAAATAAAADLLARGEALFADIEKFDIGALVKDAETAAAGIGADLAPLKAEAMTLLEGANAKLSVFGQVLHQAGLASAGPNVESSLDVGPGSNAPAG